MSTEYAIRDCIKQLDAATHALEEIAMQAREDEPEPITYAIAEGNRDFPLDMLRYDRCWPVRESEIRDMASEVPGRKRILLAKHGRQWTPERWRSKFAYELRELGDAHSNATMDELTSKGNG